MNPAYHIEIGVFVVVGNQHSMKVVRHNNEVGGGKRRVSTMRFAPSRNNRLARRKQRNGGIGVDARKNSCPTLYAEGNEEEFLPEALKIHFHNVYYSKFKGGIYERSRA